MLADSLIDHGRHLWAKSDRDGMGHSLLGHLLDTGLVARQLLVHRRQLELAFASAELGLSEQEASQLLVISVALHDIGKATPVFQVKWPAGAPEEVRGASFIDVQHGRASGIILYEYLLRTGYSKRIASSLANAIAIHHGRRLPGNYNEPGTYEPRSVGIGSVRWEDWQYRIMNDVSLAFGGLPKTEHRRYLRGRTWGLLAGLTSVADWIASSLPHTGPITDPTAYLEERQEAVSARLEDIDWPTAEAWYRTRGEAAGFAGWFTDMREPRNLQIAMAELVGGAEKPGLYVVEAPMGEGKTEAAFYAMVQPAGNRGGYLALPTQATSDAMHNRLKEFAGMHQARQLDIALAHSGARFRTLLPVSGRKADPESEQSDADAESWFSQGRRELLATLGVGTVDQALMGVLPVRHFFVRLWGLAGKTVILDEVHAYDAYTGELIARLVEWLGAVDCTVILMSATLPQAARRKLQNAYLKGRGNGPTMPESEADSDAYPLIVRIDDSGTESRSFTAEPRSAVQLAPAPFDIAGLGELLISLQAGGGAVAAVVNTIGRAQALYEYCRSRGIMADLLHGRLPLAERQAREERIVHRYGPAGVAEHRNGLVIATQVLEQSLDLDFDVMVSDLAPIDLLFQRMGRMHRHVRNTRPSEFTVPRLYITGLEGEAPGMPEPDAIILVYSPFILLRSWALLRNRQEFSLPHDLRSLVQAVYGEGPVPIPAGLEERFAEAMAEYQAKRQADTVTAEQLSIGGPRQSCDTSWGEAGSDIDAFERGTLLTPTRLFQDSVTVVPLFSKAGDWALPGGNQAFRQGRKPRDANAFAVAAFQQQLRIQRESLVRKLRNQQVPDWWMKSALIRYFLPLYFSEDLRAIADDSVSYDPDLGVILGEGGNK
jgi:CRISPR-associated endonuclease/helicase Cas3